MRSKKIVIPALISVFLLLPVLAYAQCTATDSSVNFCNPLVFESVEGVLGSLLSALQGVIVAIAVVFIVVGAILYITSAGDEKRTEMAKKAITASMVGLAIGIAAPSFLKEIYTIVSPSGTAQADCAGLAGEDLTHCQEVNTLLSQAPTIAHITMDVLSFLLAIVGTLAIIMLVAGGIMYLTAAGEEDKIEKGKKLVKFAIIGIIIALASLVIVRQIANFFT